jgi:hypothetical protein
MGKRSLHAVDILNAGVRIDFAAAGATHSRGKTLMFIKRGIAGLRGIGDATCPSDEQLAGIQDCTDPCQASSAPCITTTPATTTTAGTLSAAFAVQCAAQGGQISASGNSCTTSGTSSIAGISPSLIAVGGGLLLLLLLLGKK